MKIAVISDIHGNMQALEAVMSDIKSESVDKIYCLGDLAMAGPEPEKAINYIKNLYENNQISLIQGNTDAMIANPDKFIPIVKNAFELMGNALESDSKEVSEASKDFLNSLPVNMEEKIEDVKVLFVHGSPRKQDENIFPDMSMEEILEIIKNTDANLILCGHTHIPCGYQTPTNQTVVNTGSVGRPFMEEPKACYAIINIVNKEIDIQHRMIGYDKEKAAEILRERNFIGADRLAQMLIKPESRHV